MSTPGSKLQTAVIKKLAELGVFSWRQNNQPTHDPRLNNGRGGYRAHAGLKGVPDIICILPPHGTFCGIEIKAGKDRMSPDQKLFERRCKNNGAQYHLVRSVADVDNLLL